MIPRAFRAPVAGRLLACALAVALVLPLANVFAADAPGERRKVTPADIPPFMEINKVTPAQYAGAVSAAMESMRLVYGEMTAAEEQAFEKKWLPLFEYCIPEVLDYFNKLNPLLGQFLGIRAALNEAIVAYDEAQVAVVAAVAAEDAEGAVMAMSNAERASGTMRSLDAALAKVVKQIQALGDPPDVAGRRRRRRELDDAALNLFNQGGPVVRIAWKCPPPSWRDEASHHYVGKLYPRNHAQRVIHMTQRSLSQIVFSSREDVGRAYVQVNLSQLEYPNLAHYKEYYEVNFQHYNYIPGTFKYEETEFAGFPARRVEAEYKGLRTHVFRLGYAINIPREGGPGWLQILSEMEFNQEPTLSGHGAHLMPAQQYAARRDQRWQAMRAIWKGEVESILSDLQVTLVPEVPPDEAKRFSKNCPTPDGRDIVVRQHALHGEWVLLGAEEIRDDDNGFEVRDMWRKSAPAGERLTYTALKFPVVCNHSWTGVPGRARPGQQINLSAEAAFGANAELAEKNKKSCDIQFHSSTGIDAGRFPANPKGGETGKATASAVSDKRMGGETRERKDLTVYATVGQRDEVYILFSLSAGVSRRWNNGPADRSVRYDCWYWFDWTPTTRLIDGATDADGVRLNPETGKPLTSAEVAEVNAAEKKRQVEAKAKTEQIKYWQAEVKVWELEAAKLAQQMATADPSGQQELQFRLMSAQDWRQKALDQIATLTTGNFVRTRTAYDAYNLSTMAAHGRELAYKCNTAMHLAQRGERLIRMADPNMQPKLRKFLDGQLTPEALAKADGDHLRRVIRSLGNQVVGDLERDAAVSEDRALAAADRLKGVENLKAVCEAELMLLSFGGGALRLGYTAYMGATGYLDGDIYEATKRVVSTYNMVTLAANDAIDSYTRAVLDAHEQYQKNPKSGKLDEVSAGAGGAAWSIGKSLAMAAVMKFVVAPACGYVAGGGKGSPPAKKTPKELADEMQFWKRQVEGREKVELFQQRLAEVRAAAANPATRARIPQLQRDAESIYMYIKTDYFAKMHVNRLGRQGNENLVRLYNFYDQRAMGRLETALQQRMASDGVSPQRYRLFSNSASAGKCGLDVDLGAVEPNKYVHVAGKQVLNPEYTRWRGGLTITENGVTRALSPRELRELGQKNLDGAFRDVFGNRKADEAFLTFTTRDHPEAYRDLAWLGKQGMKHADFESVQQAWVQQAASVTGFKVNDLPRHHPSFGTFATLQEQCRGMVKDLNTKLLPRLGDCGNPQAAAHIRELHKVMDNFAKDLIGPVEANRAIMRLTGGRGMAEAVERYQAMMEGLHR